MRVSFGSKGTQLLRRGGLLVGIVMLLAGISIGFLRHRARERLEAYREVLIDSGERLVLEDAGLRSDPDAVAAGERFLKAAAGLPTDSEFSNEAMTLPMRFVAPGEALVGWRLNPTEPLAPGSFSAPAWAQWRRALGEAEPVLNEIIGSLQARRFTWDVDPSMGPHMPLPHLRAQKEAAIWLAMEVECDLRDGQWDKAHRALLAQLDLVRSATDAPGVISQLLRQAAAVIAFRSTWEAWHAEEWSDAQLLKIQVQWGELEFIRPLVSAAETDRRSALLEFALCRREPSHLLECMVGQDLFSNRAQAHLWAILRSWDDERLFLEHMQSVLQAGRQAVSGVTLIEAVSSIQARNLKEDSRYPLSRAFLGWPGNAFERASVIQALRGLAVAGLALKRYALRHEERYPESLRDLVPEYLEAVPLDWMDDQPLRYVLREERSFVLYSVGVNAVDDGGDPSPRENAKNERFFLKGKDIVWPHASEPGAGSAEGLTPQRLMERYGLTPR